MLFNTWVVWCFMKNIDDHIKNIRNTDWLFRISRFVTILFLNYLSRLANLTVCPEIWTCGRSFIFFLVNGGSWREQIYRSCGNKWLTPEYWWHGMMGTMARKLIIWNAIYFVWNLNEWLWFDHFDFVKFKCIININYENFETFTFFLRSRLLLWYFNPGWGCLGS